MTRPEHVMVRRALFAGLVTLPAAAGAGFLAAGSNGAWSAALALVVVVLNFAAHGLSLAWAAGISVTAVQITALGGVLVRLGVIAGVLILLDRASFFSPVVFALTAIVATFALLAYEVRLVLGGVGRDLEIPPDPAAADAAERLRVREEVR